MRPRRGRGDVSAAALVALGVLAGAGLYASLAFPHAATSNTVLFDREIVRILEAHCVMCHVEGGPSFPLATYEETWLARVPIHDQTLARHMPPWAAVPGYGTFANANELTLREQRFIVSWVEGLGPRNTGAVFLNVLDPTRGPREQIRARPDFDRWVLGAPDREVELPASQPIGDRLQRTVIDPGLTVESRLAALEYRPRGRDAIRAVVFTVEATGQWLATWTPWHGHRRLPDGMAYRLPAGSKIVAEIHTIGAGDGLAELGVLGLHLAPPEARMTVTDTVLVAPTTLPADTTRERLHAETELTEDTDVLALWPDLPSGTESLQVSAIRPDGHVEMLLLALEIPQDWPTAYVYETPVRLPRGSRLALTAYLTPTTRSPARLSLTLSSSSGDLAQ